MDIEKKIDQITNLTQSQEDRTNLKKIITNDLVDFLHTFVHQVMAKNDLEEEIDKVLKERINPLVIDGEEIDRLSNYEILKLKEIISREKTDSKVNLVKAIIEASKNLQEISKNKDNEKLVDNSQNIITQDDVNNAKKTTKLLDKIARFLEKTELSDEEVEKYNKESK